MTPRQQQRLLVGKLDELRDRMALVAQDRNVDYEVVEIGRILFHLLCDDLLQDVTREVRFPKVLFRVLPKDPLPEKGMLLSVSHTPLTAPNPDRSHYEVLRIGQFKDWKIATQMDEQFAVGDVLDLLANSLGGKHHRGPKKKKLETLHALSQSVWEIPAPYARPIEMPGLLRSWVTDIGEVTLEATFPLSVVLRMRN